jgi:pimeloyl-ACP methyl ester carboxylesterase
MTSIAYHEMPDGRRIAFRYLPGSEPALVFLPGYMSDMDGGKATALFEWALESGRECLLLDYSGCGHSGGDFAEGTLTRWSEEVLALIEAQVSNPVVLVGSSMGGWLMLLVGEKLGDRLRGLVGIASAPDFTDWGRSEEDKARLDAGESVFDANPYGPEPTPMHAGFWADGQTQRRLDREIPLDCPVRLIHGFEDEDVPWEVSQRLVVALRSRDVHLTLVKGGGHRLSREEDIALLLRTVATI